MHKRSKLWSFSKTTSDQNRYKFAKSIVKPFL